MRPHRGHPRPPQGAGMTAGGTQTANTARPSAAGWFNDSSPSPALSPTQCRPAAAGPEEAGQHPSSGEGLRPASWPTSGEPASQRVKDNAADVLPVSA